MKTLLLSSLAVAMLAGCASTRIPEADRLALYQAHAGEPVKQIRYFNALGWDRVDDQHVVLQMRPKESWLLRLSGPCLTWSTGSPFLGISTFTGTTLSKYDKVIAPGSQLSCQIQEIRPIDVKALRAGEQALREQAQSAGT